MLFALPQGIVLVAESAHAVRTAIDEALDAKEKDEARVIPFNLSGHGHFDLAAYDAYLKGQVEDYDHPAEAIQQVLLPTLPGVNGSK